MCQLADGSMFEVSLEEEANIVVTIDSSLKRAMAIRRHSEGRSAESNDICSGGKLYLYARYEIFPSRRG